MLGPAYTAPDAVARGRLVARTLGTPNASTIEAFVIASPDDTSPQGESTPP
jgi:hypothetical protein